MNEKIIAFQGEVQLLGWADTNTRGRTITLQLDNVGDGHPFAAAKTRAGKNSGQRYMVVMVEIGDDEKAVQRTPSQMAFTLCRDPQFWHFLNEREFIDVHSEGAARLAILVACDVTSRSELDSNPVAHSRWLTQFYNPWTAYRASLDKKVLA